MQDKVNTIEHDVEKMKRRNLGPPEADAEDEAENVTG